MFGEEPRRPFMGVRGSSRLYPIMGGLLAAVLAGAWALPARADGVGGMVYKTRPHKAKSKPGCQSGDPCYDLNYATSGNPPPNTQVTGTGQRINAEVNLHGNTSAGVFVQQDDQIIGGATVTTRTTGMNVTSPGPGGTSISGTLGVTNLKMSSGGSERGVTEGVKIKLPVKNFTKARISFEVGEEFTDTPTLHSDRLVFGITGEFGGSGGQAASAPKREPMQPPQLASAPLFSDPK